MSLSKSGEALGGIRKLLQDVIPPKLSGIKAQLGALHKSVGLLRDKMKAQEARLARVVEIAVNKPLLPCAWAESENRAAGAERRMAEMARRLEQSPGTAPFAKQ